MSAKTVVTSALLASALTTAMASMASTAPLTKDEGSAATAASGSTATLYAANSDDDSLLFVAIWYPIAVVGVTTAGYLIGLLRW